MKRYSSMLASMVFMATLFFALSVPAHAVSGFSDIGEDSPYFEGVECLKERGIVNGIGNGQFSPDTAVTVRQWAVMLCRAYDLEEHDTALGFGTSCIQQCQENGWLQITALEEPDIRICWSSLLESAFHVIDYPVYDYELYPDGTKMSSQENYLRIGKELGICGQDATLSQIATRGDAAKLLFQLLTQSFEAKEPPYPVSIKNQEDIFLNEYLVELKRVPSQILQRFEERQWVYIINFDTLAQFSKQYGTSCIGITTYSKKQICVSAPEATVHELGHFLHCQLGFPSDFEKLFQQESSAARPLLRDYSLTNSHEYFADCFTLWLTYHDNERMMAALREKAPGTYQFFFALEQKNWDC